jgi:hypothetical protein
LTVHPCKNTILRSMMVSTSADSNSDTTPDRLGMPYVNLKTAGYQRSSRRLAGSAGDSERSGCCL